MAYRYDVYTYGESQKYIDHEYKCAGRYGAKGEKRAPKTRSTPEQIKKQNQWSREKTVLRKIRANFEAGDLWVTLKLPKGARVSVKEILDIKGKFFRNLHNAYKKRGQPLKYIYRIEIGERGGVHMHVLLNRLEGQPFTADVVKEKWSRLTGGHVHYTPIYEEGAYKELADYLVKPVPEEITGQLNLFGEEEERKIFMTYNCSRNLVMPEPDHREYKRNTVRKLVEEGPEPQKGYYIDRDSIRYGTNPHNGLTYYYYTEIRMERQDNEKWEDLREDIQNWWRENISSKPKKKKKRRKGGGVG